MKLFHYIYGRSMQEGYNNPGKFSADYDGDRSFLDGVEGRIRALDGYDGGTIEVKNKLDDRAACGVRTRLCYSEYVTTVDDVRDGVVQTVNTRSFGYSHYIFPLNGAETSGREALQYSLELILWEGLFKDRHAYQQEMDKPGQQLDEDTPQKLPTSELNARYRAFVENYQRQLFEETERLLERGALQPNKASAYLPPSFSEDNLGAFLARYWQHCYAQERGVIMPSLTLLATSGERNKSSYRFYDQNNIMRDGVIFFHDQVVPRLPEAVCRIASARFGVPYSKELPKSEGRENGCIVCFPSNDAYNQAIVYCPFEDAVYDNDITMDQLLLGQAMLHGMPESYLRLEAHQAWQAASNYDTALQMVALRDLCENGIDDVEDARRGVELLDAIRTRLQQDGIQDSARQNEILYPMELALATACEKASLSFDIELYTAWINSLQRWSEPNDYLTREQVKTLYDAYNDLSIGSRGHLNQGALFHMAQGQLDATRDTELALLEQHPYQHETIEEETVTVFLARIRSLRVEGELAEAYLDFVTKRFSALLTQPEYRGCIVMTDARRLSLRNGNKSPEELCREWAEDRDQLTQLRLFDQQLAEANDRDLIKALQWYGQRKDEQLREPIQRILEPLALQRLAQDSPTLERRELIQAYVDSLWRNEKLDQLILDAVKNGGDFHEVISSQHLLACMKAFFSDERRRDQQGTLFQLLKEKQEAAKSIMADLQVIPAWPLEHAQASELIATLLCDQNTYQANLSAEELQPLADVMVDAQSTMTVSTAMQHRLQNQGERTPALAQERAAAYLDFLCQANLAKTDVCRMVRGCFDKALPPLMPEPALCQAMQAVADKYVISGESEVVQAVENWCKGALEKVMQNAGKNSLPDAERMSAITALLQTAGGDQERVLLDAIRERCLTRLEQSMQRGEFPLPEVQEEITELLSTCHLPVQTLAYDVEKRFEEELFPRLRERRTLPNREDIDSLRGLYRRFGVDEQRAERSLKTWIMKAVANCDDALDAGFAADFALAADYAGLSTKPFAETSRQWLLGVTDRYFTTHEGLPDEAFLDELANHCRLMEVDTSLLKPRLKEACSRAFGAMQWTEAPDAAMEQVLRQLETEFGVTAADYSADLKECTRRLITHIGSACAAECQLPEVAEMKAVSAFCEAHGLEWKKMSPPLEEASKRVIDMRCQQNEPISMAFVDQLVQCDQALSVPAKDRSALLRGWVKKTIDQADHEQLPEEELLDVLSHPAYGPLLRRERSLSERMIHWLQREASQAEESERIPCMQRLAEIFELRSDDERLRGDLNGRWGNFFLKQIIASLQRQVASSGTTDALQALRQSSDAMQLQQLCVGMGNTPETTRCAAQLQESLTARLTALKHGWEGQTINSLMSQPWFTQGAGRTTYESALRESLRAVLLDGSGELLSKSLKGVDAATGAGVIRRWCTFVSAPENSALQGQPRFSHLKQVRDRCDAFDCVVRDGRWKEQLPAMLQQLTVHQDEELDRIADQYGLEVLSQLDSVGRKLPILMAHASGQEIQWEDFLNEAYPLRDGAVWSSVDLWKASSGAYPILSALMEECQGVPELQQSLTDYLNRSNFGQKAKASAQKKLRHVAALAPDQLSPVLQWLLEKA